jgi:hypothetical protein
MNVFMYVCIHVSMYVRIMYVCMHVFMEVRVCMFICVYICVYVRIRGVKITSSGFNSTADSESKAIYTHGSNWQWIRNYEFLKYSK